MMKTMNISLKQVDILMRIGKRMSKNIDYYHCPHCGGYIYGLSPQKREWEVCLDVGCGRPDCDPKKGQQKLM